MAQLYYTPQTVQASQITGTLTDYIALVSLTDNRFKSTGNGGHVNRTDGRDLVPYADSALTTILDFERELYDPTTGQFIDWVRIPSAAVSTTIYYGYGDTGITTDQSNRAGVFGGYSLVLHTGDGSTLSNTDASGHNDASGPTSGVVAATTGAVAKGNVDIDGVDNHYWPISDAVSLQFGTGDFTVSLEFYARTVSYGAADAGVLISKDYIGFEIIIYQGAIGAYVGGASNTPANISGLSASTRYWVQLSRIGTTVTLTLNGGSASTVTNSADASNAGAFVAVGNRVNGGTGPYTLDGTIDEIRLLKGTGRTTAWAEADYNSQSSQATFWGSLQTEVTVGGGGGPVVKTLAALGVG